MILGCACMILTVPYYYCIISKAINVRMNDMDRLKTYFTSKTGALGWMLAVCLMCVGLFFEFLSCIASAVLCVYIVVTARRNKKLVYISSFQTAAVVSIPLFYFCSVFWAIDMGMAATGVLKVLPAFLFMVAVMQQKHSADKLLEAVPLAALVMTAVSGAVMMFSPSNSIFAPAGRLSGFLMYSNTYALITLAALIITATKEKTDKLDIVCIPVFIGGIILSGSRTVFVIMAAAVAVLVFTSKNKTIRITLLCVFCAAAAIAIVIALITGNVTNIGRFLSISFKRSTFQGRLLYYRDALPIAAKNPMGTGFLGFYYLQQSVQTGLYSVRYVHNDLLQLALDAGWIPAILITAAAARSFFKKGAGVRKRLLIGVMGLHSLMDMDFQFTAVLMMFVLLLDIDKGKRSIVKSQKVSRAGICALGCAAVYMAVPLGAEAFELDRLSHALYPWNTQVNIRMLMNEEDSAAADKMADSIIAQNRFVTVAYSAKAAHAFSEGNVQEMMKYKDKAISNAPLVAEEYFDYIRTLAVAEQMYFNSGDSASAGICTQKLMATLREFRSIPDKLSEQGRNIQDQPITELPEDIEEYLKKRGLS